MSKPQKSKHVADKQNDGTHLIFEIEPGGGRRRIGRYTPVDFAPQAPERKAPARRNKAAST
jgi:hypothetical protein